MGTLALAGVDTLCRQWHTDDTDLTDLHRFFVCSGEELLWGQGRDAH